ncbi:hypothetical protein NG796_18230 [Laspinema sp. A4]|uniref:hypothetical protein n=1 Tax=Laspinema sp. D2d TaxID=2953686 RepID=UPI0021BB6F78|nr:hypothetical protein [Laspinema sp. D2d]MCT7985215.1 hypothetical protein [Laspinema sp. D2d]
MRRFLDGGLFPTDRIPDYCQSLPPPSDRAFYWSFAQRGLESLTVARILPVILAWVTRAIGFQLLQG